MVRKSKVFCWALLIAGGCWLSDIPVGYYQFRDVCEKEAGLHVYRKYSYGKGWEVDTKSTAETVAAIIKEVPFVRFLSSDGRLVDLSYIGGNRLFPSSFLIVSADEKKEVSYVLSFTRKHYVGSIRTDKLSYELKDRLTGELVIGYSRFLYEWTDTDNTLGGAKISACPEQSFFKLVNDYLNAKHKE